MSKEIQQIFKKFVLYCNDWLPELDRSAYTFELTPELRDKIEDFGEYNLDELLEWLPAESELLHQLAEESTSYNADEINKYKWEYLLGHTNNLARKKAEEAAEEEEEEEEEEEDEEDDDEGAASTMAYAQGMLDSLAEGYSFWPAIKNSESMAPILNTFKRGARVVKRSLRIVQTISRKVTAWLGIEKALDVLGKAMDRWRSFNLFVRAIGTLVVTAIILALFAWPLYRMYLNPLRGLTRILRWLGITLPTKK